MPAQEPAQYPIDGQLEFTGGQDASKVPHLVPENAYYAGINVSTKRGALGPRMGLKQHTLLYEEGGVKLPGKFPIPYNQIFLTGKYQARIPYFTAGESHLIIVISGIIFMVNIRTFETRHIPIADGTRLNEFASRLNWSFASRYVVIYDYPARPVIIENSTARRSDPANNEVPISVMGAYNQSRLFIANAGNEFTGGDPTGSLAAPDAPITFLEVETSSSPFFGQIFQLPTDYATDPITAMGFLQLTDTSSGIGPLLVATGSQIFAFNTQNPRTTWQNGPFGSLVVNTAGIAGPRAFANVNSDLFFLSPDGQLRTFNMSRNEQGRWSRVPISREVQNWMKVREPFMVQFGVVEYFNNKILVTANPYRAKARTLLGAPIADYAHGGLVVISLDNISTLREPEMPVWDGLWTGVRPMDMCVTNNRCFIISKDSTDLNNLWEVMPDETIDTVGSRTRRIRSTVYTRSYDFKDQFMNKELLVADMPIQDVRGRLDFKLEFRPSHSDKYFPWVQFTHLAPYQSCKVPDDCSIKGLLAHSFRELKFGAPRTEACDPITSILYKFFREIQLKITIEAVTWALEVFRLKAVTLPDNDTDVVCEPFPCVKLCGVCNTDWDIPEIDICDTGEECLK